MLVSCLLPTFNRYPNNIQLINEAIESFLKQDYPHKELIICNDTPGQTLGLPPMLRNPEISGIRVYNLLTRFPTLGAKLDWMLNMSLGEYICRWDDDDISLPWRLSYSIMHLHDDPCDYDNMLKEWRPEQHWFWQGTSTLTGRITQKTTNPGNTHIMSIWHRDILGRKAKDEGYIRTHACIGGNQIYDLDEPVPYPGEPCPSGVEDQTFNSQLWKRGYPRFGSNIPDEKIFYLYRWGSSPTHLSGPGGGEKMQTTYQALANNIQPGAYEVQPQWYNNYAQLARDACRKPTPTPEFLPAP